MSRIFAGIAALFVAGGIAGSFFVPTDSMGAREAFFAHAIVLAPPVFVAAVLCALSRVIYLLESMLNAFEHDAAHPAAAGLSTEEEERLADSRAAAAAAKTWAETRADEPPLPLEFAPPPVKPTAYKAAPARDERETLSRFSVLSRAMAAETTQPAEPLASDLRPLETGAIKPAADTINFEHFFARELETEPQTAAMPAAADDWLTPTASAPESATPLKAIAAEEPMASLASDEPAAAPSWLAPKVGDVLAGEPGGITNRTPEPKVVREGQFANRHYRMYENGSLEIDTEQSTIKFDTLDEFRAFVGTAATIKT